MDLDQFTQSHFADASAAYEDATYVIFGVPYDGTTSFRPGTRFGPRAIREVSFNFEPYEPAVGIDLSEVPLADIGDIESCPPAGTGRPAGPRGRRRPCP